VPPAAPTLTWPVVGAVLCGALLHAGWNTLVKSSNDKPLDTALVHTMGALAVLPFALLLGLPSRDALPYLLLSSVIHVGYYAALAGAYQHGELGMTYPIMRGFAPLLVVLGSASVVGEVPGLATWIGVLAITLGVALVGLAHPGRARHHGKALAYAFANAAIIAVYTFVDGLGARTEQQASAMVLRYVLWLSVLDGIVYPLLLWRRRPPGQRADALAYARARWPLAVLGGLASIASYAIALWAMTRAPVASVAALRETSVLFGALLGMLLLRERAGPQRMLGTLAVVAGVMALKLG